MSTPAAQVDREEVPQSTSDAHRSYDQILRSTSLIGSVQVVTVLVGMVRNKAAALLIGPEGVGVLGSFQHVQTMLCVAAGMGIQSSAVREVSAAVAVGDRTTVSLVVKALRRACWLLGILGALIVLVFRRAISVSTFDSPSYANAIASLAVVVLLNTVSDGELAVVRGYRRLRSLAVVNVTGVIVSAVVSVGAFAWLGVSGIPLVLVVAALVQLVGSTIAARGIKLESVSGGWRNSMEMAKPLVGLGFAMMSVSIIESLVALATRAVIIRQLGAESLGAYSAANSLSLLLVGFVLSAMIADYFPRLSASSSDHVQMNRIINEQVEVGLILAVPGILMVISLAPWLVKGFYSSEFGEATALLPWLAVGSLGRVAAWPMQAVMGAMGRSRWHLAVLLVLNAVLLLMIFSGLRFAGLAGLGCAFALHGIVLNISLARVARRLCGFAYQRQTIVLALSTLSSVAAVFTASLLLKPWLAAVLGVSVACVTSLVCLRALADRLGASHKLIRAAAAVPLLRTLCGI